MHWYGQEFSIRRLHYWLLLVVLGTIANTTVVDIPFVVPLSIGNVALFLIALRLGAAWALPAAVLILMPLYQNQALLASLLQLMLLLCFRHHIRKNKIAAVFIYLPLEAALLYQLTPAIISQSLFNLSLHAGMSTAVFAFCLRGMLILDSLTPSLLLEQKQSLTLQLSHRIAMYSSIPSTLLIALVLHGATSLDLSRALLHYQTEQQRLTGQIGQQLTGYVTQIELAALMLNVTSEDLVLPTLTQQRPEFISALVTDARGNVLSFYKADLPDNATAGNNVADRAYFYEPRDTGQSYVSDTFIGRNLGNDPLFAVSTPLPGEHFRGVLELSVNLAQLTSAIQPTEHSVSHRVLLDQQQKKIWGTKDDRPLGQLWSVSSGSDPMPRQFLQHSWFNSFGPVILSQDAMHLIMDDFVTPGQWQLRYFIDTDVFLKRYHVFLALALLCSLFLLESITALSRAFITRYTQALEQLANSAAAWQPEAPPQPRPEFRQSAAEIEMLNSTIQEMQSRVRSSREAMQHSMQQIVTLNNELEQRVDNRTEELRLERDKATQLASVKTRFLANMSHEIRTPITVIKGFTEQLLANIQGSDALIMQRIQQNTEHLQRLVDDILDTAKIDEGKMRLELQLFDLQSFISNTAASVESLVSQKGLVLQVEQQAATELMLMADPFRLKQILLNLLSNAIKFTKTGEIKLSVQQQLDGALDIVVTDQGIGISPEQLPLLFQAFSQADNSTSRNFGGTGLGLYISQQLAEAMQLTLSVQSTLGHGSSFCLQIPSHLLSHAVPCDYQQIEPETVLIHLPPAKVLIVDDVADIRALLASYLAEFPFVLTFAADGEAAITLCQKQSFDLIIMDQQMPGLDGRQATAAIRALGITTPVLSLSADVFEEPEQASSGLFQQNMTKPFTRQALLEVITNLLQAYPPMPDLNAAAADLGLSDMLPRAPYSSDLSSIDEDELSIEYRQSLPGDAATLTQLWSAADWPAVQTLLHKIKGTSACFGLNEISEQAKRLGQQLKQGDISEAELRDLLDKLTAASV
jgi:signal transduction histidine kinase